MAAPLNLDLPNRQKPGKQDHDIQPKAMEDWIAALPMGHVGKTAQQLYTFLIDTNKLKYRPADRFACLESLREPLHFVSENLQPHFISVDFPLPDKSYQIACVLRELHATMAMAYMIIAEDVAASSALFRDKTLLGEAIHRAISYQSQSLLTHYQIYAAFQGNNWKVLHALYGFAEKHKLHTKKIADEQHQHINRTSITNEYLRILLLYLAEPHHLRQTEVGKIYINLERWLDHLKLIPVADPDSLPDNSFVVNLQSDAPPFYKQFAGKLSPADKIRLIDTHKLADLITEELARPQEELSKTLICFEMQQAHLNHDTLRWLKSVWCARRTRKLARNKRRDKIEVSFGINHVHQLIEKAKLSSTAVPGEDLSQHTLKALKTERLAEYEAQEVEDVNAEEEDVWETVYEYDEHGTESKEKEVPQEPVAITPEPSLKDNWTLVNESAGGFCLRCKNTSSTSIRVGELVGIHHPGSANANWTIGIIRWLKNHGKSGIEIGGQLIAPQVLNINVSLATAQDDASEQQRALWIPANKITRQPASLITLSVPHRVGSIVRMQHGDNKFTIRLTRQLGNSGMFAQFLYEVLEQDGTGVNESKDDFDDVWALV